jgi:hypothetical protein
MSQNSTDLEPINARPPRAWNIAAVGATALFLAAPAAAGITTFFGDKQGWDAAAGASTKLDLVGEGFEQLIPFDWYQQELGITLASKWHPEAWSWVLLQTPGWADDGWGATTPGNGSDPLAINFDSPQRAFGYDSLSYWLDGPVGLSFYLDGQWLATSYQNIPFGTPPDIRFHGWVTDFDFDRVVIEYGQPVDNIHIVPGPSSVVAFACAVAFGHRRRRGASATSR